MIQDYMDGVQTAREQIAKEMLKESQDYVKIASICMLPLGEVLDLEHKLKKEVQKKARSLWQLHPTWSISAIKRHPDIVRIFGDKYGRKGSASARGNLHCWLSDADPRAPENRCGRKRRHLEIPE